MFFRKLIIEFVGDRENKSGIGFISLEIRGFSDFSEHVFEH